MKVFAALLLCVFLAVTARAADGPAVAIKGFVKSPQQVTLQDLRALPVTEVDVAFTTGHGDQHAHFRGVLLWTLLEHAGGLNVESGMRDKLRHSLLVTGRDGYAIALSEGEIDPEFEGKLVIIAFERDGKPLEAGDGLRLVVPGDHRGGRSVRDVTKIDVK